MSPTRYARHIGALSIHEQPGNPTIAIIDDHPAQAVIRELEADARLLGHVQHQGLIFRILPVRIEELSHERRRNLAGYRCDDRLFGHRLIEVESEGHQTSVSCLEARR